VCRLVALAGAAGVAAALTVPARAARFTATDVEFSPRRGRPAGTPTAEATATTTDRSGSA